MKIILQTTFSLTFITLLFSSLPTAVQAEQNTYQPYTESYGYSSRYAVPPVGGWREVVDAEQEQQRQQVEAAYNQQIEHQALQSDTSNQQTYDYQSTTNNDSNGQYNKQYNSQYGNQAYQSATQYAPATQQAYGYQVPANNYGRRPAYRSQSGSFSPFSGSSPLGNSRGGNGFSPFGGSGPWSKDRGGSSFSPFGGNSPWSNNRGGSSMPWGR
jgi:hypothetical protein